MNLEPLLNSVLGWIAANPGWIGLVIFLTALSESLAFVGLIVPGAMMMFGFGALIALGHLEFWPALGYAAAGALAGDGLSFWLGRAFHQRLRQLWPFSKHPETLARGEEFFRRHGGKSVLLGRFFGPIRAVTPTVAGMLDMPTGKFIAISLLSALLWAPAYLLPGIVFAASLELASQVAWRMVVLIVLVAGLLFVTVLLVRSAFRLLHPRIHGWLQAFLEWGGDHPLIRPISASLLDPEQGELRGLATLTVFLLASMIFLSLLINAAAHNLPTALDQSLYHFLQDLRTPWADDLMVFITELGGYPVKLSLTLAVFAWLYWKRYYSAAWHWLAVLGLGLATNALFNGLVQIPRPADVFSDALSYSFPSNTVTLTTIIFGFLAVLMARETTPARRWIPYLAAALLMMPIIFSRLYLGANWLTSALAGLNLGLLWVALLGLAYNRHPAPPLDRRGLFLVSLVALLAADLVYSGLHHEEELRRYRPAPTQQILSQSDWWQNGWQRLPRQRLDFRGKHREALVLQWAGTERDLQQRLSSTGWQTTPPLTLQSSLAWLNPQVRLADLPVLPQVHDGRPEDFKLIRPSTQAAGRWVLRFWDAGLRLREGNLPVWLGSLSLQGLERRMDFFSLAVDRPYTESPLALLAASLEGLRVRTVSLPDNSAGLTLISPRESLVGTAPD